MPESFFKPHANGRRGFTEWGFMSTTSDKQIAVFYSSMGSHGVAHVSSPMVLELTVSAVDRGACIKVCLCEYVCVILYLYTYIYILACMHICMCINMHTHINIWFKTSRKQTYIHTYTHTQHLCILACVCIYTHNQYTQELSQYPHEVEYLWVPCSFVAPAPGRAERMEVTEHGVVRIVPVHVNSNQSACTLEQMLASKKHTHLAAFRYGLQELQRDLAHTCSELGPTRYLTDFYKESGDKVYLC